MLCDFFFLEIFILTSLNWIIHKNYAISDFRPIFFFRDIEGIKDSMIEKICPKN